MNATTFELLQRKFLECVDDGREGLCLTIDPATWADVLCEVRDASVVKTEPHGVETILGMRVVISKAIRGFYLSWAS